MAKGGGYTLSESPPLSKGELTAAICQLDAEGYCLLKNRIPRDVALSLADEMLAQHDTARPSSVPDNEASFNLIFGLFNTDERTWQYMPAHPDVLKVAGHFLGHGQVRAIEGISGRTLPGAGTGALHKDCAQDFQVLPAPECCWGVNGIWMLTDFTEDNGSTKIVKRSHVESQQVPHAAWEASVGEDASTPVLGGAGDVFLWHMGTLHQSGANVSTSDIRVSFNCGYAPSWFNHRIMGGHQPIHPPHYKRIPEAVREYLPRVTGFDRHDAYEYQAVARPPTDPEPWGDWDARAREMLQLHGGGVARPLPEDAVNGALSTLAADGYCVLDGRLGPAAVDALAQRLSRCHGNAAMAGGEGSELESSDAAATLYGLMNEEPATWCAPPHWRLPSAWARVAPGADPTGLCGPFSVAHSFFSLAFASSLFQGVWWRRSQMPCASLARSSAPV
jgi:ectoine hydroxylase-related dioxygenase (phytanoyl-CoA dioxygenase family)